MGLCKSMLTMGKTEKMCFFTKQTMTITFPGKLCLWIRSVERFTYVMGQINRNLMIDLEPRVVNKIQTSAFKNLYNSG